MGEAGMKIQNLICICLFVILGVFYTDMLTAKQIHSLKEQKTISQSFEDSQLSLLRKVS